MDGSNLAGTDEQIPPHQPQNRETAESKLRRGKKHCPLCLARLTKVVTGQRVRRSCLTCGAHPQAEKSCRRCAGHGVWEGPRGAACQRCGLHGAKRAVIGPGTG